MVFNGAGNVVQKSDLARMARGMKIFAEAAGIGIMMQHVKSHQQHPWNELADVIAKVNAGVLLPGKWQIPGPPESVAAAVRRINWDWAWLATEPTQISAPRLEQGNLIWGPVHGTSQLDPQDTAPYEEKSGPDKDRTADVRLRILSASVQTMWQKQKYLEEQCVQHDFQICCFQETRMHLGYCETAQFHRFTSESEGKWGAAIWMRKQLKIDGRSVSIASHHCCC